LQSSIIIEGYSKQDLLSFGASPTTTLGKAIEEHLNLGMIIKDITESYANLNPAQKHMVKELRSKVIKQEVKKYVQLDFSNESDRDQFILKVNGKELIKV